MPKLAYEQLKELLLSKLKKGEEITHFGMENERPLIYDVIHDLFIHNIIREMPNWSQHYCITSYGQQVLNNLPTLIYLEPKNYIMTLKEKAPNIDQITLDYANESVLAYQNYMPFSCAVMLGCASESSMLSFIDTWCDYLKDPIEKQKFDSLWAIKQKYEHLIDVLKIKNYKSRLIAELKQNQIAYEQKYLNEFITVIELLFNIYRITRNDAGHPTGSQIEFTILEAQLKSFVMYAEIIYGMKNILAKLI